MTNGRITACQASPSGFSASDLGDQMLKELAGNPIVLINAINQAPAMAPICHYYFPSALLFHQKNRREGRACRDVLRIFLDM